MKKETQILYTEWKEFVVDARGISNLPAPLQMDSQIRDMQEYADVEVKHYTCQDMYAPDYSNHPGSLYEVCSAVVELTYK